MRKFFTVFTSLCCMGVAFVTTGCGSDDTITNPPIASLDDLRAELPCTGGGTAFDNCATVVSDEESATLAGEAGVTYDVSIQVTGVMEQKTYSDWTSRDGMWIEDGTPDGSSFNVVRLQISSPAQTYYLNAGESFQGLCYLLDFAKTVVMSNGATITLYADTGGDQLSILNIDGQGVPIVAPGVPPAPAAYDGQFLQVDVVSITVRN